MSVTDYCNWGILMPCTIAGHLQHTPAQFLTAKTAVALAEFSLSSAAIFELHQINYTILAFRSLQEYTGPLAFSSCSNFFVHA